ncbi:hypothetical protein [Rubritalea sp.]|uniref:hypothetical protein n=1 Tax=Rubritalea sp. TaxID=2109375 RepID=UPI003EF6A10F
MRNRNTPLAILYCFLGSLNFLLAGPNSTLHFINGDSLSGEIVQLDQDIVTFQADDLKELVQFHRSHLLNLSLPSSTKTVPDSTVPHLAILTLEDRFYPKGERDQIKGKLVRITDDFVELDTPYAGELKIDRSLIYSFEISNQKHLIYSGPNSLDEWNELGTPASWSFANNALITGLNDSSIAVELDFPTRSHLHFTVDRKKNIDLSILLYADSAETENPDNYYDLTINSNYLSMQKHLEKGRSEGLTKTFSTRASTLGEQVPYDIYVDLNLGEFSIYVSGELTAKFSDPSPAPEIMGNSLHFSTHRSYEMRIRNIELSKWNGTLPIANEEEAQTLETEGNLIRLANGDALSGNIGPTVEEKIEVETEHAAFDVPISSISSIQLTPKEENHPRADTYDLKAYFKSGGWIILDPISLDSETLVGNHEAIGDVSFDLDTFSKIEFNIYDRKLNALREDRW